MENNEHLYNSSDVSLEDINLSSQTDIYNQEDTPFKLEGKAQRLVSEVENASIDDPFRFLRSRSYQLSNIVQNTTAGTGVDVADDLLDRLVYTRLSGQSTISGNSLDTTLGGGLSNRLIMSAEHLAQKISDSKQRKDYQLKAGFHSRETMDFYTSLLDNRFTEFGASYFQMQNLEFAGSFYHRAKTDNNFKFQVTIQSPKNNTDSIGLNILLGNRLMSSAATQLNRDPNESYVQEAMFLGSFHPKIGYAQGNNISYAWMGTQNITPVGSTKATIEPVYLVSNRGATKPIYNEIKRLTKTINSAVKNKGDDYILTGDITRKFGDSKYIKVGNRLFEDLANVIQRAASQRAASQTDSNDKVFMAMSEINLLLSPTNDSFTSSGLAPNNPAAFKQNILTLARQNRLQLTIDQSKIDSTLSNIYKTLSAVEVKVSNNIDNPKALYDTLKNLYSDPMNSEAIQAFKDLGDSKANIVINNMKSISLEDAAAIRNRNQDAEVYTYLLFKYLTESNGLIGALATNLHDKTVAIIRDSYSDNRSLEFYQLGSANLSASALLPYNELSFVAREEVRRKLERKYGTERAEQIINTLKQQNQPLNLEAALQLGRGIYNVSGSDISNSTQTATDTLLTEWMEEEETTPESMKRSGFRQKQLAHHLNSLSNGFIFNTKGTYQLSYKAELPQSERYGKNLGQLEPLFTMQEYERIKQITRLKNILSDGGSNQYIKVEYRFDTSLERPGFIQKTSPIGLRVSIGTPDSAFQLKTDVTVNTQGQVIFTDLNKVINGALYVNASNDVKRIKTLDDNGNMDYALVDKMHSRVLSPLETAVGLVNTMQRVMLYQQEHALVQSIYSNYMHSDPHRAMRNISNMISSKIKNIHTELNINQSNLESTNLVSVLDYFISGTTSASLDEFNSTMDALQNIFVSKLNTRSMEPGDASKRKDSLQGIFKNAKDMFQLVRRELELGRTTRQQAATDLQEVFTLNFLRLLSEGNTSHLDYIRKELVLIDREAAEFYKSAARGQSRTILTESLSPYLSAHEETYNYLQGATRLPVYGEVYNFEYLGNSPYTEMMSEGLLNPLPVTHGTYLGESGRFYRALGSVSYGDPLRLPAYGSLRSLAILDSDISSQASVVHDFKKMQQSTTGMMRITKDKMKETLSILLQEVAESEIEAKIESLFKDESLEQKEIKEWIHVPFTKVEQITQRVKNVIGMRPALTVQKGLLASMLSFLNIDQEGFAKHNVNISDINMDINEMYGSNRREITSDELLSGRLRTVLPEYQYGKLQEDVNTLYELNDDQEGINYELLQTYYRTRQLDLLDVDKGFIGPSKLKRVAINQGISLLGDFSYFDYSYNELYGKLHRVRFKVNPNSLEDPVRLKDSLAELVDQGVIVTSSMYSLDRPTLVTKVVDGKEVTETVSILEPGAYTIKDSDGSKTIYQVGKYVESGFIEMTGLYKTTDTLQGARLEGVRVKIPAFAKRDEAGIAILTGKPSLVYNVRGTLQVEADVMTYYRPSTSSRILGGGFIKGPVVAATKELFSVLRKDLDKRDHVVLRPDTVGEDIFAYTSLNVFKGYTYESGMEILAHMEQPTQGGKIRDLLYNMTGEELAKAFSLLFMGDAKITEAVRASLTREGKHIAAGALHGFKGVDISKTLKTNKEVIQIRRDAIAAGLTTEIENLSLLELKERLLANKNKQDILDTFTSLNKIIDGSVKEVAFTSERDFSPQLMYMAAGLGLIAEDIGSSFNILDTSKGLSLEPMKKLILGALSDSNQASILQQRFRKLLQLVEETNPTTLERTSSTGDKYAVRFLNEQSMINRAAGILTHMLYYNRQIFRAFEPKQDNYNYEKIKFDHIGLYVGSNLTYTDYDNTRKQGLTEIGGLSHISYKNIIDSILTQAGVDILITDEDIENDSENFRNIKTYLKILQGTQDNAVIMENIVDVSFSQSLVASGMKDSVKAEYQFMVGMPNTQMRRFRNYMSLKERSGEASSIEQAFYTLLAQSQIGYSALSTERSSILSYRLGLFTPSAVRDETVTDAKGLNMSFINPYFMYSKALAMSYSKSTGHTEIDINEPDFLLPEAVREAIKIADENALMTTDYEGMNSYSRMVEIVKERYKNNIVTNPIGDYLSGLAQIEQELIMYRIDEAKHGRGISKNKQSAIENMLQAVQNTTQIILPTFEYKLIKTGAPEDIGNFRINFIDTYKASPTTGVLMGTDILSKIALNFGGHKDEVLLAQNKLMESIENVKDVLHKISSVNLQQQGRFLSLSEDELNRLIQYKQALDESRMAMFQLVETEVARQALGDHESLKGVVGIATNSFILNPNEYVVGQRYERVVSSTRLDRLINTALKQHLGLAKGEFTIGPADKLISLLSGKRDLLSKILDRQDSAYIPSLELNNKEDIINKALGLQGSERVESGTKAEQETNRILMTAQIYAQAFGLDTTISTDNNDFIKLVREVINENYAINLTDEETRTTSWADIIGTGFIDSSFFNVNPERQLANRLALYGGGTIGRTGQPGGASANLTGSLDYKPQSVEDYIVREKALNPEGKLRLDKDGFLTGFIVPSLSSLIAGLGDYDGDSYRLIVSQTQATAKELLDIQREVTIINNIEDIKVDLQLADDEKTIASHEKTAERKLKETRRYKLAKRFANNKNRPRIMSVVSGKKNFNNVKANIKFRNVHNQSVQLFRHLRRTEIHSDPRGAIATKNLVNNFLKMQLAHHAKQMQDQKLNVTNQKAYMRSNYGGLFEAIDNIQGISDEHKDILKRLKNWWGESPAPPTATVDNRNLSDLLAQEENNKIYLMSDEIESLSNINILERMQNIYIADFEFLDSIDLKKISNFITGKVYDPDLLLSFSDFTREMKQYVLDNNDAPKLRSFVAFDDYSYDLKEFFAKLQNNEEVSRDDIHTKQYLMSAPLIERGDRKYAQTLDDYITNLVDNDDPKTVIQRLNEIPFVDTRMMNALGDKRPLLEYEEIKTKYTKALTDISKANQIIKLYKTIKALPPSTYEKYFKDVSKTNRIMKKIQLAEEYIQQYKDEKNSFYQAYKQGNDINISNLSAASQRLVSYLRPLNDIETRDVGEESDIHQEMTSLMDLVISTESNRVKEAEAKSLIKLKTFIGTYLGLAPKLVEKIAPDKASVGRLIAALQQKYDMSQVDTLRGSGAMNINSMRKQLAVLLNRQVRPELIKLANRDPSMSKTKLISYIQNLGITSNLSSIDSAIDYVLANTASLSKKQVGEKIDALIQHYVFTSGNLAATIEGIGSSVKKAAGIVLNPFEFDAAVQVIGEGGTKLIGEAYNTFIPLLDSLTMQTGFVYGEAGSDQVRALLQSVEPEDGALYSAVQKFLSRDTLEARFSGTVGLLANMQQIVRDALKAKDSDGSLLDLFRKEIFVEGTSEKTTFAEALSQYYDALGSPSSHYKVMQGYLGSFLRQQMGPVIANDPEGQGTFLSNEPQNPLSAAYKVRGFGAMLMLTDFTRLAPEELGKVFLEDTGYGLKSIFDKWLDDRPPAGDLQAGDLQSNDLLNQFLSEYIGDLLIRTQAEFAASNVKEPDFIYQPLKELLIETKNRIDSGTKSVEEYSTLDRLYYDLYDRVFDLLDQGQVEDKKFKTQVIAEQNRLVLEARRADDGILDYNMFSYLREINQATMGLTRTFDDDTEGTVGAKYMIGNTLILRQAAANIQRGKGDMAQILYMASNKLNVINRIAAELLEPGVYNNRDAAEAELRYHVRGMLEPTGLNNEEITAMTDFLLTKEFTPDGNAVFRNLNIFSESSAALASSTSYLMQSIALEEKRANEGLDSYEQTHLDTINVMLRSLISENQLNVDIIRQIQPELDIDANISRLMEGMSEHLGISYRSQTDDTKLIMRHSAQAETVGIIAGPLIMALAGNGIALDERTALFALDIFQGYAELLDTPNSFVNQVNNQAPDKITKGIAQTFQFSRIRQAMNTEGIAAGLISGLSQELAYKAVGRASHELLQDLFRPSIRRNPTVANVGIALGAEVLSTVFAQGFTRALYKRRGMTGYVRENMDMLLLMDKVIEQAWRFAEFLQEQAINSIEVHDAENLAEEIDMVSNAYLSQYESDILLTQLVVIDANDSHDSINFYDSSYTQTVMSV